MRNKILWIAVGILLIASDKINYRDGNYTGISRAIYTEEPYFGISTIRIENGNISQVQFVIRDSARQVDFDSHYEKYFEGNDIYINQCRENWKGIQAYPDSLVKYQDLNRVDAISGATWAYNIFKASATEALVKAGETK